jgi:hypothetical protein
MARSPDSEKGSVMKYQTSGATTRDWIAATKNMKVSASVESYSQDGAYAPQAGGGASSRTRPNLDQLIERARKHKMTGEEREAQIRSFAYGNTHMENDKITREDIDRAAIFLKETRSH